MTIIKIEDARKAGFCNHGLREFFRQQNWDWLDFVQNGMDAEKALKTNDANVKAAYEYAVKREQGME